MNGAASATNDASPTPTAMRQTCRRGGAENVQHQLGL